MRALARTSADVEHWFSDNNRRSACENSITLLREKSIFLMSKSQFSSCAAIIANANNRFQSDDLYTICTFAALHPEDDGLDERILDLKSGGDPDGVIPGGTSSPEFREAYLKVESVHHRKLGLMDSISVFDRIMGSHLELAKKIVIIDPYAAKNLLNANSDFSNLLEMRLLENPELEIEIHTNIAWDFYGDPRDKLDHDTGWWNQAKEDFLRRVRVIGSSVEPRESSLTVFLYRKKSDLGFSFPHDRHFEFVFTSCDGRRTVADYFQLGNGVSLFSNDEKGEIADRGSDLYSSTFEKMWRPFKETTRSALDDGKIVVNANQFGKVVAQPITYDPPVRYVSRGWR